MNHITLLASPLQAKSPYKDIYDPSLLFAIPRQHNRDAIGIASPLPFSGVDLWTAYEISWLNKKGKPQTAIGEFIIPCQSNHIVESKSLKLYLNSFNQTKFKDQQTVRQTISSDLSQVAGEEVIVRLYQADSWQSMMSTPWSGTCLDDLDISISHYHPNPRLLKVEDTFIEETVYSHLLKSNCPVTNQPDWGSLFIQYAGKKLNHQGLLKYIISFRQHGEFHEHCVERIFNDILHIAHPEKLTVYARFTRRGGLDINPFRSNFAMAPKNLRLPRQ